MNTKHQIVRTLLILGVSFCISCGDQQEKNTIFIPIDKSIPFKTVNMTDSNGWKQGPWQEDDKINSRIKKEYNYENDTLNGYYLEYKTASSDTLIFGYYIKGQKDGKWTFWSGDKNEIEWIEIYKNGTLLERSPRKK